MEAVRLGRAVGADLASLGGRVVGLKGVATAVGDGFPPFASNSVCADRETGLWDLIRMTAIPSWRLVSGQLQALGCELGAGGAEADAAGAVAAGADAAEAGGAAGLGVGRGRLMRFVRCSPSLIATMSAFGDPPRWNSSTR